MFIFIRIYKKTMKKILLNFTLLILVISSCKNDDGKGGDYNTDECYLNPNAQTLVHDGINREYILYIPNSYYGTSQFLSY